MNDTLALSLMINVIFLIAIMWQGIEIDRLKKNFKSFTDRISAELTNMTNKLRDKM